MIQRLFILLLAFSALSPARALVAQDEKEAPAPSLEIVSVEVTPATPAADTLCRLSVQVKNTDDRIATQLGFTIKINGQELPVYGNHLFMFPLAAKATSEVPLYNFWSTETSRPMPANGKLEIEVTLREARWMDISMKDGTETWAPLGDVEGLPATRSVTLTMAKNASAGN